MTNQSIAHGSRFPSHFVLRGSLCLMAGCGASRTPPVQAPTADNACVTGSAAPSVEPSSDPGAAVARSALATDLAAARIEQGANGLPLLTIPRASEPIRVNGRMDEPAWRTAALTGPLVDPASGTEVRGHDARAVIRALWDDQYLYLGWLVADEFVVDPAQSRDGPMWEGDAVDFIVDPDGNGRDYYEVMVSPSAHTLDAFHLRPPTLPGRGDLRWNPDVLVGAGVLARVYRVRRGSGRMPGDLPHETRLDGLANV